MSRLPRHIVSNGQSLVDVSIQRYGSAEGLFALLEHIPGLSTASVLKPGQELVYDPDKRVSVPISRLFAEKTYVVNAGQAQKPCGHIGQDMISVSWLTNWDGTKHVVQSATVSFSGIISDAVFSEDIQIYDLQGNLVGTSSPGATGNPHDQFFAQDPGYGTVGLADFGFLPGTYLEKLAFDQVTLLDGTICSGNPLVVFQFESTWTAGATSVSGFDYVLPQLFD